MQRRASITSGQGYFSGVQGRFSSPDPSFLKWNKLISPQRWNLYPYAVNNPLNYVDPDGHDAIAIVYPKFRIGFNVLGARVRIPGLGHGGMVIINKDGTTRYRGYGRYDAAQNGQIRGLGERNVATPPIERDAAGNITEASLTNLLKTISENGGQGGPIEALYFPTSEDEDALMNAYLDQREAQGNTGTPYSPKNHNCGTLFCDTLRAAGKSDVSSLGLYARPIDVLQTYQLLGLWGNLTRLSYNPQTKKVNKERVDSTVYWDLNQ